MYLRYTPEIYKTQALLQVAIKDQPSELSEIYSNSFNPSTNLNAEIELIKSQKSISRLIEKLDLNTGFVLLLFANLLGYGCFSNPKGARGQTYCILYLF